jgi:hypothetical protein
VVLIICKEIRRSIDKKMRIFCTNLFNSIEEIEDETVFQMMQKEEFTYN